MLVSRAAEDTLPLLMAALSETEAARLPWWHIFISSGIVQLKAGDHVELLIPRSSAIVSLEEDSTFLGAVKLG